MEWSGRVGMGVGFDWARAACVGREIAGPDGWRGGWEL
jgi:hypothetical protein